MALAIHPTSENKGHDEESGKKSEYKPGDEKAG
jgi:hypothetical protein